ncbi:MAG: ABC transporter permease [Lachnospiraceae bacterium]|nr:ABC transporter permease [Lachnospiraceae bacterium]
MNVSGVLLAMQGAVSQGVLWGIMVLGVYITYKILDIADLTVDGSFALGGCVCAVFVVEKGMNPLLALVIATIAGMLAGAVTGILHTLFDIPAILAGILTQIGLWSINLRIMGKSNVPLLKVDTIFSRIVDLFAGLSESTGAQWLGFRQTSVSLVIGILIAVLVIVFLYWLFGTEIGCALRATGNNEDMIRALGVNTKITKLLALTISNGLVGLSGALVCQSQKYADIGMGTGAIVIGLAAIVIGDVLMGRLKSFGSKLTSAVVGSVVYFLIRAVVLQLGMDANDMKLLSAVIVALALCIPVAVGKWRIWKSYSEEGPTC